VPPRRNLKTVSDKPRKRAPDLRDAVETAIQSMTWLTDADEAMKTLALRQADEIEQAVDRSELLEQVMSDFAGDAGMYKRLEKLQSMCDATKVVGWLGPQLQGVLRDLGGAPAARAAMKPDKPVGGRLAQLRAGASPAGEHDS
jgi:hypothetical protein